MDYQKAYKEAFAHAREIHRNEEEKRRDMEFIFPELKETEDERIKKELIEFTKTRGGFKQEWITWLENIPYTIDHEKREGFYLGYKAGLEKQSEKKNKRLQYGNIGKMVLLEMEKVNQSI